MIATTTAISDPISEALRLFVPAWPLQNAVAVNPFWYQRDKPFWETMSTLESGFHQHLMMPIDYFRDKYARGEINTHSLSEALSETRTIWQNLPHSVSELINLNWSEEHFGRRIQSIAQITPHRLKLEQFVINEIGKFASSYFDDKQALLPFPWKTLPLWEAWIDYAQVDKAFKIAGFREVNNHVQGFSHLSSRKAIEHALNEMGLVSTQGQYLYLQRLAITIIGWGSQLSYNEWQKSLGVKPARTAAPEDLLAVRVLCDYLIFQHYKSVLGASYSRWAEDLNSSSIESATQDDFFGVLYTWQLAAELSYQKNVSAQLTSIRLQVNNKPKHQLVFCIDVRSEMIRRHIEETLPSCQTRGFAGFFAAGINFKSAIDQNFSHRLPVLLKPSITLDESKLGMKRSFSYWSTLVSSYFRAMRKKSAGSLLFVELFGVLSAASLTAKSVGNALMRRRAGRIPSRFQTATRMAQICATDSETGKPLTQLQKADYVSSALRHMGLFDIDSRIIALVGHGSVTTNNAFGSTLDCGACGGHAGDINASFLAHLLNDSSVRTELKQRGFTISSESWFCAAVHETVTDEIYFLETVDIPEPFQKDIADLAASLNQASRACQEERQVARSAALDPKPSRRSNNWAELRPEWGLAGNACFLIAPRRRSKGTNLSGRAFMHDYDWRTDRDFKTLELIMTAPMVVTNWINMQYYASVVAPHQYGAGNKVLHNLVNECGVLEGNGGDLKIGLAMQSIHDGEHFVHDPLRLSVFIEAPQEAIEAVIKTHQVVADLINNQWLLLNRIDPDTGGTFRRLRNGTYQLLTHP